MTPTLTYLITLILIILGSIGMGYAIGWRHGWQNGFDGCSRIWDESFAREGGDILDEEELS